MCEAQNDTWRDHIGKVINMVVKTLAGGSSDAVAKHREEATGD